MGDQGVSCESKIENSIHKQVRERGSLYRESIKHNSVTLFVFRVSGAWENIGCAEMNGGVF